MEEKSGKTMAEDCRQGTVYESQGLSSLGWYFLRIAESRKLGKWRRLCGFVRMCRAVGIDARGDQGLSLPPSAFILSKNGVVHAVAVPSVVAHQCTPMHTNAHQCTPFRLRAHQCTASDLTCTPTERIKLAAFWHPTEARFFALDATTDPYLLFAKYCLLADLANGATGARLTCAARAVLQRELVGK
jgi:hypothetical protein